MFRFESRRRRVNSTVRRRTSARSRDTQANMNRKQWTIMLAGIALFGLSELFPPWVYEDENTSVRRSAGYHVFNSPPKIESPAEMRAVFSLRPNEPTKFMWVHVNGLRLYVQRFFLIALT